MLQNVPLKGHRDSVKSDAELAEGNLIELLWHRVEKGNRNLEKKRNRNPENHVQNGPRMSYVLLLQFIFLFVYFCSISR